MYVCCYICKCLCLKYLLVTIDAKLYMSCLKLLSVQDLSYVDFSYASLKNVFFSRANLQCAKFRVCTIAVPSNHGYFYNYKHNY